jgi:hypothetical protein
METKFSVAAQNAFLLCTLWHREVWNFSQGGVSIICHDLAQSCCEMGVEMSSSGARIYFLFVLFCSTIQRFDHPGYGVLSESVAQYGEQRRWQLTVKLNCRALTTSPKA